MSLPHVSIRKSYYVLLLDAVWVDVIQLRCPGFKKGQAVPSSERLIWPLKKTSPLGLSCHLFS